MKISHNALNAVIENPCRWRTAVWAALFPILSCVIALSQDFSITGVTTGAPGKLSIHHQADTNFYYLLLQGETVTNMALAADIALATNTVGEFVATVAAAGDHASAFFRVRRIPLSQPLDTDRDGLDDVWELRFRRPGAALNGSDAQEDHTGSGTSDFLDYQLPIAYFDRGSSTALAENSKQIQLHLRFSKSFTSFASVLVGGTAVQGQDYLISGFVPSNQTARVNVAGSLATFTVTLLDGPAIDPDRYLLLSILEPATNALARYLTSQYAPANHTLHITDGDKGVYAGFLEFTNGVAAGAHSVRLGIRSSPNAGSIASLDGTRSTLLGRSFTMPVTTTAEGVPVSFPQPLSYQTVAGALQRSLTWKLDLGTATSSAGALEAPAALQLRGLSASGHPIAFQGRLRLVRITTVE